MTTVSLVFLSGVFCLNRNGLKGRALQPVIFLAFLAVSLWMVARIKKNNDQFLKQIQSTRGLLNELKAHKDTLFVFTNKFDDNGFYIWDTPGEYPAANIINVELVLTRSYDRILRRFQLTNLMQDIPYRNDILIAGPNLPLLHEYYLSTKGLNVRITKVDVFTYLTAYEVTAARN